MNPRKVAPAKRDAIHDRGEIVRGWMYLGGTAILIVVGVALDTMKQLQIQLVMRQYRGFIN